MASTTWTEWGLDDMRDAAGHEGSLALNALRVPVREHLASLPYRDALAEHGAHIAGCHRCADDRLTDCAEGEALGHVARIGVTLQHRLAESN